MTSQIEEAFDATCSNYSADRVIADPELNSLYIAECRRLGLENSPAELNRALLNLRKRGRISGRPRAIKTRFPEEDDYRFAAEIAVRFLERRDSVTLDSIICDPEIAREFDSLAERIAPGFTSLHYRWAALNLRKAKRLKPELVGRVVRPVNVINLL